MRTSILFILVGWLTAALALPALAAAQGGVIETLTDTSQLQLDGVTLVNGLPQGGYAVDLFSNTDYTVRGVTFKAQSRYAVPPIQVPGIGSVADMAPVDWLASGYPIAQTTGPDADSMQRVLSTNFYGQAYIQDIAVTTGKTYKVQLMGAVASAWPTVTFNINIGAQSHNEAPDAPFDTVTVTSGTNWIYTTTFTATSDLANIFCTFGPGGASYDVAGWTATGGMLMSEVQTAVPGDADHNNKVDFADYLILEATYGGAPSGDDSADFDNSGTVDFADYLVLEANYGTGTAVPEPMTMSLLGLGALALIRRR